MPSELGIDVVFLPRDLQSRHLEGRSVAVFDVLRATSSIAAALAAGVRSIHIFPTAKEAAAARNGALANALLCGERNCLPPPGFDLGNSPGAFDRSLHADRDVLMSTTNGTRAILAAASASRVFAAALVNGGAVARALLREDLPITLLCAGTDGAIAMEDILGAGAVVDALFETADVHFESDAPQIAHRLFAMARADLPNALCASRGGRNLIDAHLPGDIDFCARLDVFGVVGIARGDPPVISAMTIEM